MNYYNAYQLCEDPEATYIAEQELIAAQKAEEEAAKAEEEAAKAEEEAAKEEIEEETPTETIEEEDEVEENSTLISEE